MATLSITDLGELAVTLRGPEEDRVLTTLRGWPHWQRAAIERDPEHPDRCTAVTLITNRDHEPTIREILKRSFGMTFPAEGGSREIVPPPPTRSRHRS